MVKIRLRRIFLCGYFLCLPSLISSCHRLTFGKQAENFTVTVNMNGDIIKWRKGQNVTKGCLFLFNCIQEQIMNRYK